MPRPGAVALTLTLWVVLSAAGALADVAPGSYVLQLPGRTTCGATQGLLSVGPCSGGSAKVSLFNAFDGTGRQVWSMQPVYTGVASITNKTLVLLQVGGRSGCGSYATYPPACSGGVTVTELVPGSQAQHWYLEPWGVMYRLRAAACPGKYLAVSKGCGNPGAQLLAPGPNNTDSFTLKAVPASPGSASPSPSPKASSPSPSPSPKASSPSPKASPRPPLPRPPPPAASPLQRSPPLKRSPGPPPAPPTPVSRASATAAITPGWAGAFEGSFVIVNNNSYTILSWTVTFNLSGGAFTWGPSDVDLTYKGPNNATVKMTPKTWIQQIKPGATLTIAFGGNGNYPNNVVFTQVLPLLDPLHDASLTTRKRFPTKLFAPFVDITVYPAPNLMATVDATGQLFYTLAFITADPANQPAWAGLSALDLSQQYYLDQVRSLRLRGGDVIVSFGGAAGQELAQVITNLTALVATYQSVIDMYALRWIDFDVEGSALAEPPSVDRRNQAIKLLQAANPGLTVSYTLPVLPAGLTADGVYLIQSAVKYGARVDVVNLMTMDFGDSAAPAADGRMGTFAIWAAGNTSAQATAAGMTTKIGVTPMIGLNDVESETFHQADARQVGAWAAATPWMRWTAFWSVGRDNWDAAATYVSSGSSSIQQQPYEFTSIFKGYAGAP